MFIADHFTLRMLGHRSGWLPAWFDPILTERISRIGQVLHALTIFRRSRLSDLGTRLTHNYRPRPWDEAGVSAVDALSAGRG